MVVEEEDDDAYLERAKNKWEGRLYFPNSKKMGKELEVPLLPHPRTAGVGCHTIRRGMAGA